LLGLLDSLIDPLQVPKQSANSITFQPQKSINPSTIHHYAKPSSKINQFFLLLVQVLRMRTGFEPNLQGEMPENPKPVKLPEATILSHFLLLQIPILNGLGFESQNICPETTLVATMRLILGS
ncbi:hypothetical protein LINGRAHAP2_LOCUS26362, partial [Linum grandiflorum]